MRTVVVGLGALSVLLFAAWQSNRTTHPLPVPGEPATAQPARGRIPMRRERVSPLAAPTVHQRESALVSTLASLEMEADEDRRSEKIDQAVASPGLDELPAMLDSLSGEARPVAVELRQLLLRRWAESDPSASAEWAILLPEGEARHLAVAQVAVTWADSDLVAATAWVRGLPEGDDRNAASLSLAYEAARTDSLLALELARALPATRERDDLIAHAVSQWTGSDAATATTWATSVPDPALRERLLAAVAVGEAEGDGMAAASLIAQTLGGTDQQDRAVIAVVQRWTQISPASSSAWIAQFPESAVRDAAAQTLIGLWTFQDPQAAGLWVRDLPNGSLRDIALGAYVQALADNEVLAESASGGPESPDRFENDFIRR